VVVEHAHTRYSSTLCDPAAGVGVVAAMVCDQACAQHTPGQRGVAVAGVTVVAFQIDDDAYPIAAGQGVDIVAADVNDDGRRAGIDVVAGPADDDCAMRGLAGVDDVARGVHIQPGGNRLGRFFAKLIGKRLGNFGPSQSGEQGGSVLQRGFVDVRLDLGQNRPVLQFF